MSINSINMKQLLKNVLIKKAFVKNALEQYRKMMSLTGLNYEKEINEMLDQLISLEELQKKIEEKLRKK